MSDKTKRIRTIIFFLSLAVILILTVFLRSGFEDADEGQVLLAIQNIRTDVLTPFMTAVSHAGNSGKCWILITALLLIFAIILRKTAKGAYSERLPLSVGLSAAIALILSLIITNLILKNVFVRIRPYEVIDGINILVAKEKDASFPSGHASASFACASAILMTLPKKTRWIGIVLIVFAAVISVSRLYVGVHYPTDVIGGAAAGLFCGVFAVMITDGSIVRIKNKSLSR